MVFLYVPLVIESLFPDYYQQNSADNKHRFLFQLIARVTTVAEGAIDEDLSLSGNQVLIGLHNCLFSKLLITR